MAMSPDDKKKKELSDKIAKLVREGKPQDQAVAMAYAMQREKYLKKR